MQFDNAVASCVVFKGKDKVDNQDFKQEVAKEFFETAKEKILEHVFEDVTGLAIPWEFSVAYWLATKPLIAGVATNIKVDIVTSTQVDNNVTVSTNDKYLPKILIRFGDHFDGSPLVVKVLQGNTEIQSKQVMSFEELYKLYAQVGAGVCEIVPTHPFVSLPPGEYDLSVSGWDKAVSDTAHLVVKGTNAGRAISTQFVVPPTVSGSEQSGVLATQRNFVQNDITKFLRGYTARGWDQDDRSTYVVGIKGDYARVVALDANGALRWSSEQRINGLNDVAVAVKWGRVYVATASREGAACQDKVYWDIWRVNENQWEHIYRSTHREGGFLAYLVKTNNYVYGVGDYSVCGAWGTKVVSFGQDEDVREWESDTYSIYYSNHAAADDTHLYMVHVDWSDWTIYWEEHMEGSNDFFKPVHMGLIGTRPAISPLTSNRFAVLVGTTKEQGAALFIKQGNSIRKIFTSPHSVWVMGAGSDGKGNAMFCVLSLDSNHHLKGNNYVWVYDHATDEVVSKGPFAGVLSGKAFQYGDQNPGCVWTTDEGKVILISAKGVFH